MNKGKSSSGILISIVIIIVIAGGFLLYVNSKTAKEEPAKQTTETAMKDEGNAPEKVKAGEETARQAFKNIYKDDALRISFGYPDGFTVNSSEEEGGKAIVVHNPKSDVGFQIFVSTFDGGANVTKEDIQSSLPNLVIEDPQEVLLGSMGKGLAFFSKIDGQSRREVWFSAGGHLYQISAPRAYDEVVRQVLNNWTFF